MTKNEIKKALYREKPIATRVGGCEKDNLTGTAPYSTYSCMLENGFRVDFVVPHSDMGDTRFDNELPAQLLIRWMV